jgi:hypothetical protein
MVEDEIAQRKRLGRILLVAALAQLALGVFLALTWVLGLKAPGPLASGVLTLGLWFFVTRDAMALRSARVLAAAALVVGLLFPWPWVRYSDQQLTLEARWSKVSGSGPACTCIDLWIAEPFPSAEISGERQARLCLVDASQFRRLLGAGDRVLTRWYFSKEHSVVDGVSEFGFSLEAVADVGVRDPNLGARCALSGE